MLNPTLEEPMIVTTECIPTDCAVIYASVYEVSRHFGGREEGGWWFNNARFTKRSIPIRDEDEARNEAKAKLLAEFEDQQPRFDIYSCANDGPQYEVWFEESPGEQEFLGRPRYE